jgi:polysaccharide deacetylase family protein (PEP-CTERM system associated)
MEQYKLLNALTVDVEDYYHVRALEPYINVKAWDYLPTRVVANTNRILEILEKHGVKGTFFVLGWVAKKIPYLIKKIHEHGHELASHGYEHKLAYEMTHKEFRADVRKSKNLIEDITGTKINGFRATSFSIILRNLWCLDVLIEEGFTYDSSIFPIYRSDYGIPDWHPFPKMISCSSGEIYELPPSTVSFFKGRIPVAGGAYLRFFPLQFITRGIRKLNNIESKSAVFYIHPWEIDSDQPRIKVNKLAALRHYGGIEKLENKFISLLNEYRFGTAKEVIRNISVA